MLNTSKTKVPRRVKLQREPQPEAVTLALRVDRDIVERLDFIAQGMERSRASVCTIALREFAEREYAFHVAIAEGEADIAAGRVVPHEEVVRQLSERIGSRARRPA